MYLDKWLMYTAHFLVLFGATNLNSHILFFGGHDIYFDDRYMMILKHSHDQPFDLKSGDSGNDHPNENGLNSKLKSFYNRVE